MRRIWVVVATAAVLTGGCAVEGAAGDGRGAELTVLAAASLTDAFAELGEAYESANEDVEVTFVFGASSSLREQILEGAPADVFAPASQEAMDDLAAADAVGASAVLATNRLELAVPRGNPGNVRGLADLARVDLLVGLCAAEVPCGAVAADVLAAAGVRAAADTEEADVRALLTKLEEGELDAGLVYATDVLAADGEVEGIDLPGDLDATTAYPIAVTADASPSDVAQDFVAFVLGPEGQQILRSHGFGAP